MPLGPGVKYRYKKGTHTRLAFKNGKVIEAKNMKTGKTHTPAEFKADKKKKKKGYDFKKAEKKLGIVNR
jgi:hypothetical protein